MTPSLLRPDVAPHEITRKKSLGDAIGLCAEIAGFDLDKSLSQELDVDKGQFSRWLAGTEGIKWPKLKALMSVCGNDAPVLWMLHDLGYDITSLRQRETEVERENRLLREENAALRRAFRTVA